MAKVEIFEMLAARKNFYQFLHKLFYAPLDAQTIDSFLQYVDIEGLEELGNGGKLLQEFFHGPINSSVEAAEFTRLFIGPGPMPAPPWESFYTGREQLLFDESMYLVREQYYLAGLKFVKENNEPDDHLLLELEFMIHLITKSLELTEQKQLNDCLEKQRLFLMNHLGRWIGEFAKKLVDCTNSKLYKGAGFLAMDFIINDMESLRELMGGMANVKK
ncbi:hypothetical protein D1B31_06315 [Neobacillus notoginsengisoli]|uniref:Dehydrogenase n=1 Tax=Neobacillus notoginsengisoli TaxID=1578198 RepID=A0A417YXF7_9BACI|nr:molecular chaperone TorD family protein [Neobacillus notoginsengisoli]RHW42236.1 hypothetical protein D1B31_06315 [Neobacillus notoginsengisoli]